MAAAIAAAAAASLVAPVAPRWEPNSPPQRRFLELRVYESLYGGAVGGGKSEGLLMGALQYIGHPRYRALLLRRTFPELARSLVDRALLWYPVAGGVKGDAGKVWRFPSGAVIEFGHLEHEHDVFKYFSAEYQYLAFDELTSFTESQYRNMLSRVRSSSGIPVRVRAGSNPGNVGHEWVLDYWAPWLRADDPDYTGPRAEPGEVMWYVPDPNQPGGLRWVDRDTPGALTRVFIPAKATDNPAIQENDPSYLTRLDLLDVISRERLKNGNWLIKPSPGLLFRRAMFKFLDTAPLDVRARVRFWDRAATEEAKGKDPDWTVGARMSRLRDGTWCLEDVVRLRGSPAVVEKTILETAKLDGVKTEVRLSQDPGSAGKFEAAYYINALAGFTVSAEPETGDKVTRAQPLSAQCEAGNVSMVRGPWNEPVLQILEAFPTKGVHDDDADAIAGAFSALTDDVGAYIAGIRAAAARR